MNCGITGHTGALGQEFIKNNKNNKNIKFIKFHGDLTQKTEIDSWVKKNTFNVFFTFCCDSSYKIC